MGVKDNLIAFGKRALFTVKRKSPELMTAGAILFGIGTVIFTWKAARAHDKALEEPKKIIATAKSMELTETYTKKEQQHDILVGYVNGAREIVKLYGPAALMGGFSIACVLGSHRVLSRRNAGLVAANGILAKEFKDYRDKVIEKYGLDEDYKFKFGDKEEKVTETVKDENGEEKTVEKTKAKEGYENHTFDRCFDESSLEWRKDPQYNFDFIIRILRQMNDKLGAQGYLRLNDVYEALGFEKTQQGEEYGWIRKSKDDWDVYVSFGCFDEDKEFVRSFLNGTERNVWLSFNCRPLDWSKSMLKKG